jgi:hypothetical protein
MLTIPRNEDQVMGQGDSSDEKVNVVNGLPAFA